MPARLETYYADHWVEVEPERMEAYERMFEWREGLEPLIAPARVGPGQVVVDFGCGPGHLAIELARRVGPEGRIIALDVNREFLERTRARAERAGLADRVTTELLEKERLPLTDSAVDRVVCKNVLEYVPDPATTVAEFRRVLRPGGIAHVSDSDWGALIVEPLAPERVERIMSAAGVAFRTPRIGRSLYGLFRAAGFQDVSVQVLTSVDTLGRMRPVISNLATYARASGRADESELEAFLGDVERAVEEQTYLAILPQFLVTGCA